MYYKGIFPKIIEGSSGKISMISPLLFIIIFQSFHIYFGEYIFLSPNKAYILSR